MKASKKVARASRSLFRLCVVDGALDENRVRDVAKRIATSKRRGALRVLTDFQRLVRLERDRYSALVESASPLSESVRQDIQAGLAAIYGSGLDTSFEPNPALIGGVRIKVGSDVYDGSVRARLAALAGRL
jgi:F-type H+-transporting ATPase subunit delta